jgi:hypothetical protein
MSKYFCDCVICDDDDNRDFKLFHVNLNRRNCPSAKFASAANAILYCIFNGRSVLMNDLLLV